MATVSLLRLPVKQLSNIDPDVLSPVFQSHPLRGAVEACDLTASFPVPHGLQPVRLPLLVCHPALITLACHRNPQRFGIHRRREAPLQLIGDISQR